MESELFGYEAGAFTGAKRGGNPGLFELAHGGTLFLDEIGEMPIILQSRLLRVIQEKVVRRIGGNKNIPINVRIISATNRDLLQLVKDRCFREDLYYRLNVLKLQIPPLRERKEDIPEIADIFARRIAEQNNKRILINYQCFEKLEKFRWNGNVRELTNFIERMVVLSDSNEIRQDALNSAIEDLAFNVPEQEIEKTKLDEKQLIIPIGSMHEMEQEILKQIYDLYNGDKKKIESLLELSSTTLWRRLKDV